MRGRQRLTVAAVVILTGAVGTLRADAHDGAEKPAAVTGAADNLTTTTARLNGTVTPDHRPTLYAFQYGTTTAYGTSTPLALLGGEDPVPIFAEINGLQPATIYHFRLVVADHRRVVAGADAMFETAGSPLAATAPGPLGTVSAPPPPPPPPPPVLGERVVVAAVSGVVRVRTAAAAPLTLGGPAALPVGTIVDTRAGTARITTATGRSGRGTQSVLLRDGVAQVTQRRRRGAFTDLRLRGGDFSVCTRRASAAAVTRRRPPRRTLWARDAHGRFRTRGRNSVATVRGTIWRTTDTCRGTTTTVSAGTVAIRNLRSGRRVVVRAGGRYLARSSR